MSFCGRLLYFYIPEKDLSSNIITQQSTENPLHYPFLLLCFFLFQLLSKIDIRKSRIENKIIHSRGILGLHSIKSMEFVEKTELLRLSVYTFLRIHLDRYGSFFAKFCLYCLGI